MDGTTSTSAAVPEYFELSWAILSTIGLSNIMFGMIVVGISGFSPISLVPIITSAAGAIANGMCYYAYYADYPVVSTAVASGFADMTWMIQEAGLSFYSYVILRRVLRNRSRTVFMILFWLLMVTIFGLRMAILATRVRDILTETETLQTLIDHLHVGYFACIAAVECLSSFFLLHKFNAARKISMKAALKVGLFSYLMKSTEIRLALLAVIGVTRAVTYSFQDTAQSATTIASQLDRFAYTLECMFPVMMFIDILASRLAFATDGRSGSYHSNGMKSSSHATPGSRVRPQDVEGDFPMFPLPTSSNHVRITAERRTDTRRSSQEFIIEGGQVSQQVAGSDGDRSSNGSDMREREMGGISKTVEFRVYEAREM